MRATLTAAVFALAGWALCGLTIGIARRQFAMITSQENNERHDSSPEAYITRSASVKRPLPSFASQAVERIHLQRPPSRSEGRKSTRHSQQARHRGEARRVGRVEPRHEEDRQRPCHH